MTIVDAPPRSLSGRRVIVTREDPGELADLLITRGAEVLHIPLIAVADPPDDGVALARELGRIGSYDWLVVTSPEGARRTGGAAASTDVRLAAVGAATARVLRAAAGRDVDVVPSTQLGDELAAAILLACGGSAGLRVLVAQADLASSDVGRALRAAGADVVEVTAYATSIADRSSAAPLMNSALAADAVLFASGSAVHGWVNSFGRRTPPVAIAIGPSTAAVAREMGLDIGGTAADHSLEGLVTELERHLV
ncbi:MAG: uroporphyrinogen-III synthase [Acidimicrobiia bacterium]|nr:uroporphyrinogen-III synthase [Acidimicrobiia bacterium]